MQIKTIHHFNFNIHIFIYVILFTTTYLSTISAQIFTEKDVEICNSKFRLAADKNLTTKPINEIIIEIGKSFFGTDYETHTLEKDGEEQLVINLTGLDCTTFLENALVFARCIKKGKTLFEDYQKELTLIRYRSGVIEQYPSRLHYFTDWIFDNEKKGIIKDVTKEIGGKKLELELSFMSDHPNYYKNLVETPDFIPVIRKQEEDINKREYYFIPQENIAENESKIEDGDLLAFTSTVNGLDVNHVGIAIRMDDGRIHILHAPNVGYKVQISELPLAEYVQNIKKDSGIIIARVLEPGN